MDLKKVEESANYIKSQIDILPSIGIILGSGLGEMAEEIKNKKIVRYEDVPNLPSSTVKGHAGQFVFGDLMDKKVVMMQGRFHYYEGNSMESLSLPIYIMKSLGVKNLILTNAAGGVNIKFKPGDLMLINDHINFGFNNPLIGYNDDNLGPRFPDMSNPYDKDLIKLAKDIAIESNIDVKEGTYLYMTGPCYETPAEIRMVRTLGGDAVGMSTVPETIAAKHCGLKVLGISCITNMASGILDQPLNHKEVTETANLVKNKFSSLVRNIINKL